MRRKRFMKVGEFARLCKTTRDTLLHYDRKGVLCPKHTGENGYRYYGIEQYWDFDCIGMLKELGHSLDDIRNMLAHWPSRDCLGIFREGLRTLEEEQRRLAHRRAMLIRLMDLVEETLRTPPDSLVLEDRPREQFLLQVMEPVRLQDASETVESYAASLLASMERGNTIDPPLGRIVPLEEALKGHLTMAGFFFRNEGAGCHPGMEEGAQQDACPGAADRPASAVAGHVVQPGLSVRTFAAGRYAALCHEGDQESHSRAFAGFMQAVEQAGLQPLSDVLVFEQMSYVLSGPGTDYVARYMVLTDAVGDGSLPGEP